ncbi:MAG TPA: YncE family protein [Polyangia bacterium]
MRRLLALVLMAGCGSSVSFPADGQWPAAKVPAFVHQARFAVTDNLSDELSYVDAVQPKKLGDVPVGDVPVELEGPHHLAASPDGKYIYYNLSNYVPGTGSGPHGSHGTGTVPGSLVKLDAATQEKVGEVLIDRSPGDVILTRDGRYAFVSHYDLLRLQSALTSGAGLPESSYSAVAIVDTTTMTRVSLTPVCPTAHGEGLSADEQTLYVTCANSDELALVDVADKAHPMVTTRLHVGPTPGTLDNPSYAPYALAVSPADGTVWVSDNRSADVRVFDPGTMQMDAGKTVNVNGVAMFASFSLDGKTIYVPHQGDDQMTAIDTQTLATRTLPLPAQACLNAHAFVLGPDGINGVVVCEGDHVMRPGSVVFVNTAAFAVTGFVNVGMFSDGAAWLPAM